MLGAVLVNNFVLNRFLGICPFLGVSKRLETSLGMSGAVIFVMTCAAAVTWCVQRFLLKPLGLDYLQTIAFILVIAAFVQLVEMLLKRYLPPLYSALGIYLPLITTNCVVLYVTLDNIIKGFDFAEMVVYSLAVPTGFMLVLYIFATIRERLDQSNIPEAFKGNPIALIVAAVMAAVFGSLAGLV